MKQPNEGKENTTEASTKTLDWDINIQCEGCSLYYFLHATLADTGKRKLQFSQVQLDWMRLSRANTASYSILSVLNCKKSILKLRWFATLLFDYGWLNRSRCTLVASRCKTYFSTRLKTQCHFSTRPWLQRQFQLWWLFNENSQLCGLNLKFTRRNDLKFKRGSGATQSKWGLQDRKN